MSSSIIYATSLWLQWLLLQGSTFQQCFSIYTYLYRFGGGSFPCDFNFLKSPRKIYWYFSSFSFYFIVRTGMMISNPLHVRGKARSKWNFFLKLGYMFFFIIIKVSLMFWKYSGNKFLVKYLFLQIISLILWLSCHF